jgi:hypothetical protein
VIRVDLPPDSCTFDAYDGRFRALGGAISPPASRKSTPWGTAFAGGQDHPLVEGMLTLNLVTAPEKGVRRPVREQELLADVPSRNVTRTLRESAVPRV